MNKKSILSLISLFLMMFFLESSSYAGRGDKENNEWGLFSCIKKCLKCFKQKQILDDEDQEPLISIKDVPTEILWEICYKLFPQDIIQLTLISRNFKGKIGEEFWESYIRTHNQKRWEQSIDAVKVAFAFLLFKQGNTEKAAKLGFPLPEIMKKQENEKIAKDWERAKMKAKMREKG